jgi:hypothetical protein
MADHGAGAPLTVTPKAGHRRRAATGGAAGNERLTAMTGAVLLVLFAAEGVTVLSVHRLLTLHFFLGMLLVGPVALKVGSTGYRFVRYYSRAGPYVRKGPPAGCSWPPPPCTSPPGGPDSRHGSGAAQEG